MATILRSSKYIRCLNVFARRIIVSCDNSAFVNKKRLELLLAQCTNTYLTKSYATIPAIQRQEYVPNVDESLEQLDRKAQRYGRVFKFEVENILSKVRTAGNISSLDALLLIRCCGNLLVDVIPEERSKLVNEIWTTLEALNVPINVSHFNALFRVFLENNTKFEPLSFLTMMREKGVQPNRITYQRLILYHCKKGDIAEATKILEFMRENEIPLNEAVFSALITGHSEANDLASAENILNVMKEAGVEPSSSTYIALMNAYAKRGDMASIKQTLDDCGKKNFIFYDKDYFDLIQTLAANDHTEKVEDILKLMPNGPNYNLDAVHAILKVLDVGNVQVALQILPTLKNSERMGAGDMENENGTFLIRKLVNSNYPPQDVAEVCELLQRQGQNVRAFSIALHRSFVNQNTQLSLVLMESWKKNSGTIKEHYFWPLLATSGTTSNYQGILDVVKIMMDQFDIVPGIETITYYILPFTVGKWDDIVLALKDFHISHDVIITSIAIRMLNDKKPRKTAIFMLNYPGKYDPQYFYRSLAEVYKSMGDGESVAVILRTLFVDSEYSNVTRVDVVDDTVNQLLLIIPNRKYSLIEKIFENMIDVGLSMSPKMGVQARQYFADNINPSVDEKIDKLTSGTLTPVPFSELSSFKEERNSDARGETEVGQDKPRTIFIGKRRELDEAIAQKNIEAVKAMTKNLETLDFTFSPALYAQLVDVFSAAGDLELAEQWKNKCKEAYGQITLDIQKITDFASLLIKNGRLDDAISIIKESPREPRQDNYTNGIKILVKRLMDTMVETGDVEKTKQLLEALLECNYYVADAHILGRLVKVHLVRDDLAGALKTFEEICLKYRYTPLKNELSKKFISIEDADSLQKLTDLSTEIHGESNALIDLVLSLIECGRLRQARKILETPGLKMRSRKIQTIVDRYVDVTLNDYLDQFIDLTKGLPVVDRQEFYEVLMTAYNYRNDWQRGLNLWMTIQDEDIQPSNSFFKILGDLLKRNNEPVPFAYDEFAINEVSVDKQAPNNNLVEFYKNIQEKDLHKAEQSLQSISRDHPEFSSAVSSLIMAYLLEKKDVDNAVTRTEEMILHHGRWPRAYVLKAVWNALIETKQFDKLRKHGNILSERLKKKLRFKKFLARVEIEELGLEKFIMNLESKLKSTAAEDHFKVVTDTMHFTTLIKEFKKDPSALNKFMTIADQLWKEEIYTPINIIWSYYFETNQPEADVIWMKYLQNSSRIIFKYLLNVSLHNNDVQLAKRLYNKVNSNEAVPENGKLFLLTHVVGLYMKNGKIEDVLKMVENLSPSTITQWRSAYPINLKQLKDFITAHETSMPANLMTQDNHAVK